MLSTLARERILRPVHNDSEPAYEIFHDVLADAVLAWRTAFEKPAVAREREAARRRHRRLMLIVLVAALALAAMGAVTLYALSQRNQAQRNEATARTALAQARTANDTARAKTLLAKRAAAAEAQQAERARASAKTANEQAAIAEDRKEQGSHRRQQRGRPKLPERRRRRPRRSAPLRQSGRASSTRPNRRSERPARSRKRSSRAFGHARPHGGPRPRHASRIATKAARDEGREAEPPRLRASGSCGRSVGVPIAVDPRVDPETSLSLSAKAAELDPGLPLVETSRCGMPCSPRASCGCSPPLTCRRTLRASARTVHPDPDSRRCGCPDLQYRLRHPGRIAPDGACRRPHLVLAGWPHDRDRGEGPVRALGRRLERATTDHSSRRVRPRTPRSRPTGSPADLGREERPGLECRDGCAGIERLRFPAHVTAAALGPTGVASRSPPARRPVSTTPRAAPWPSR